MVNPIDFKTLLLSAHEESSERKEAEVTDQSIVKIARPRISPSSRGSFRNALLSIESPALPPARRSFRDCLVSSTPREKSAVRKVFHKTQSESSERSNQASKKMNRKIGCFHHARTLLKFVNRNIDQFNTRNIATAFHRLAKHVRREKETLSEEDLALLIRAATSNISHFNARELANIAWTTAHLKLSDERFCRRFFECAYAKISTFNAQELSNTAWALARHKLRDERLLQKISECARAKISKFNQQNLANLAWAFFELGSRDVELFRAISKRMRRIIDRFLPINLRIAAWASVNLDIRDKQLFDEVSRTAQNKIEMFTPEDLANLAGAFARFKIDDPELFRSISTEAQNKMELFKPKEIARLAESFANLRIRDTELFGMVSRWVRDNIQHLNPHELSTLAWSFHIVLIRDLKLLEEISRKAQETIELFNPLDLSMIVIAFADLNIEDNELFVAISDQAKAKRRRFDLQNLVNTAWSLTLIAMNTRELNEELTIKFSRCIFSLIHRIKEEDITKEEVATQLYQIARAFQSRDIKLTEHLSRLAPKIRSQMKDDEQPLPSRFHREVARTLENLGIAFKNEAPICGFFVDIVLNEHKIAIEADGPTHFARDERGKSFPTGKTLFKKNLIQSAGYRVISIPYWEWSKQRNNQQRCKYLTGLLPANSLRLI